MVSRSVMYGSILDDPHAGLQPRFATLWLASLRGRERGREWSAHVALRHPARVTGPLNNATSLLPQTWCGLFQKGRSLVFQGGGWRERLRAIYFGGRATAVKLSEMAGEVGVCVQLA